MAYGLNVWDASGNVRLDTTDREVRFVALYTGTTAGNSTTTITVSGMSNDGTWGLNDRITVNYTGRLEMGTNLFKHVNTGSSSLAYEVEVFRV